MTTAVIFDLGGVLIDWDPRHLYGSVIDDPAELDHFLGEVCTHEWHREHDRGRSFADGVAERTARFPEYADLIALWGDRFGEMIGPALTDTVAVAAELKAAAVPLYGLTNWAAEAWPIARERFDFLAWFEDIVVSGEEGLLKPDPALFRRATARFGVEPGDALFIDDVAENVAGARSTGLQAVRFEDAGQLRRELVALGLPLTGPG